MQVHQKAPPMGRRVKRKVQATIAAEVQFQPAIPEKEAPLNYVLHVARPG